MDKDEILRRIAEEDDYIRCPKFANSLNKFLAKNPEGVDDKAIARLLMISEEEVAKVYEEAVRKLREKMGDE